MTRTRHWLRTLAVLLAAWFLASFAVGTWIVLTGRADAFMAWVGGLS